MATPSEPTQQTVLLGLPLDVRNRIYNLVVPGPYDRVDVVLPQLRAGRFFLHIDEALILVCRQVQLEVYSLHEAQLRIHCDDEWKVYPKTESGNEDEVPDESELEVNEDDHSQREDHDKDDDSNADETEDDEDGSEDDEDEYEDSRYTQTADYGEKYKTITAVVNDCDMSVVQNHLFNRDLITGQFTEGTKVLLRRIAIFPRLDGVLDEEIDAKWAASLTVFFNFTKDFKPDHLQRLNEWSNWVHKRRAEGYELYVKYEYENEKQAGSERRKTFIEKVLCKSGWNGFDDPGNGRVERDLIVRTLADWKEDKYRKYRKGLPRPARRP